MLLIDLDRSSPLPAYLQIRDRIVALVDDGTLRPGDRLPPTRVLAASLGIHRSTVVRAYEEIRALGYLESRPGSYTTVRRRARPPATRRPSTDQKNLIRWDRVATGGSETDDVVPGPHVETRPDSPGTVDFQRLAADPVLAPVGELRRCLRQVIDDLGGGVLDYADPAGWPPLRETLAGRLRTHGIAVSPEEILVTAGAQQAIDLVLRLLTRPGDRVVIEAPTYGMLVPLLRLHGIAPVEVPMLADGMDLDALSAALGSAPASLVYTMPNFHNPTGVTTDQAHRERLLQLCEHHRVPILEDGFEEEMKYFGRAVLPVKSLDRHGLVVYVGTFSKVVFPGLRVGWLAAPRDAVARLAAIQHGSCLAANTLAQAVADRFSSSGGFEVYLRRIHRAYRGRMQSMLAALERHLPRGVGATRPAGGYTVWLTLPEPVDREPEICDRLHAAGVLVSPGRQFFATPPARAHLRLSIACVDDAAITHGCQRLGEVLGDLARS